MEQIKIFLINNLKSLGFALIYLILGLLFLPEGWIIIILKKMKPNLIKKMEEPYKNFINTLANLFMNNGIIDISDENSEYNEQTEHLLKENKKIEKNIYVIDLCKDIVSMFRFIYPDRPNHIILEQAFNYLQNYAKLAESITQDNNFVKNFYEKINSLDELFREPDGDISEDAIKVTTDYLIKNIFNYLSEERNKLENLLSRNKNELIKLLKGKTHAL
jgi:hypothetical protein